MALLQVKHVGNEPVLSKKGRDKQRGNLPFQESIGPAADACGPLGQGGSGGQFHDPVPAIVVLNSQLGFAAALRLGQDDFLLAVAIQVRCQVLAVSAAHDLHRLFFCQGVTHQGVHRPADLPAHQDVHAAASPQVQVVDGLNLAAHPFNPGIDLVFLVFILLENHNFQGVFRGCVPEKRHGLLHAVSIHIHQLNGLPVFPAEGGNVLRASFLLVDLCLKIDIGL